MQFGGAKCDLRLFTDLAALVAGAHPQLVDLRFSHVGPLLGIVQLVLELPVLGEVAVGLLLLQTPRAVGRGMTLPPSIRQPMVNLPPPPSAFCNSSL